MQITKPLKIKFDETNRVKTSSGEFLELISWKENKDLAVGIGIHKTRFPSQGYICSKKVDEIVLLLDGKGRVVVNLKGKNKAFELEKDAIIFIPKNSPFFFIPTPYIKILTATGPAWYPKQQSGLDYRRKESGRIIL